jgi:ATP-dependent RNA helicase DHX37/DHR1
MSRGIREASSLVAQVISLVAGLAVQEIFFNEAQLGFTGNEDDARDQQKQAFGRARATLSKNDKLSDASKLLTAVNMYSAAGDKDACCSELFLRPKALFEVSQLQRQLQSLVKANHPSLLLQNASAKISPKQARQLSAFAASGYIDQVAIRADLAPSPPEMPPHLSKPRRAIDVPYLPLIPLTDGRQSASVLEKVVFIHPSSVLARQLHKDLPQYIVYSHLQKAQAHNVNGGDDQANMPKTRMFPLTPVDGRTLVELAKDTALLEFGKPVLKMKVTELGGSPRRRECWVTTELRGSGGGGYGWPLPAVHVRQVIDTKASTGWRVEEVLGS